MAATGRQNDAITSHDKSTVVTAGAGTGKTFVLVQKYIDLIATRGVPVPSILALTFTDKAATEMKERIRREIQKRSGPVWEKAADDFMGRTGPDISCILRTGAPGIPHRSGNRTRVRCP